MGGPIRLVHSEDVIGLAVISDVVPLLAHTGGGQTVGNALGVIPYNTVSGEVPNEVCSGGPSITVNVHGGVGLVDVKEEGFVVEDVHDRLVVLENSGVRKWPSIPRGVWHGVILQDLELSGLHGRGIYLQVLVDLSHGALAGTPGHSLV
jgi:hypothetical protein